MAAAPAEIGDVRHWPDAVVTLRNEHRYMSLLLDTLEQRAQADDFIAPQDYFLIHDIVQYMHEYPDAVHHPTEDLMFERLIERDPSTKSLVRDMQRDHDGLTGNTDRILKLLTLAERRQSVAAANAVRAACGQYVDRLRAHMQTEESELFPKAVECLEMSDWKAIELRLDAADDPLFGRTVDSRFRVLYEYFSAQLDTVSRTLTLFSFLQMDRLIESADALEKGAGEMVAVMRDHGNVLVDECRKTWQQTRDSRSVGSLASAQIGFVTHLGKQALEVGSSAAGIYFITVKQMFAPFVSRK